MLADKELKIAQNRGPYHRTFSAEIAVDCGAQGPGEAMRNRL